MAHLITLLAFIVPVAAVFVVVYSNKKIYDALDEILTYIFEKF